MISTRNIYQFATATGTPDVGPNVNDDDTDDQVFYNLLISNLSKQELIDEAPISGHNPEIISTINLR